MHSSTPRAASLGWDISIVELAPNRIISKTWHARNPLVENWGNDMVWIAAGQEVEVDLDIQIIEDGILVRGQAEAVAKAQCVRCLAQLEYDLQAEVDEVWLEPAKQQELLADGDEEAQDMPVLDGTDINVESLIRDSLILEMPFQPLCDLDCRGICAQCGQPYADLEPDHQHEILDSRWAAISAWGKTEK